MKRIAVFASYSSEGIIADYILYYLQGLKKVVEEIIFIADNSVSPEEEEKLKGLVTYSKCERHGCYDFGSYRRGFEWAEKNGILDDADELIFCNDSCYGPVFPFENVFSVMEKKECDFWGIAESHEIQKHLQSYFLVFKKNVFSSHSFKEYVHSFEKQDGFWDYVKKYETNFAGYLSEAGFKYASYLDSSKYEKLNYDRPINPTIFPLTTLRDGMPLVKRKVFGCQYCFVLRDMPYDVVNYIKSVNGDIYEIIMRDVGKSIAELKRPIKEEMARTRNHIKNLENILYTSQKHIGNLEYIRDEQQKHIENLKNCVDSVSKKNKKHLNQIKTLVIIWFMTFAGLILSLFL